MSDAAGGPVRARTYDAETAAETARKFEADAVEAAKVGFIPGLWVFVWIFLAITGGEKRKMVTVDEYGHINLRDL